MRNKIPIPSFSSSSMRTRSGQNRSKVVKSKIDPPTTRTRTTRTSARASSDKTSGSSDTPGQVKKPSRKRKSPSGTNTNNRKVQNQTSQSRSKAKTMMSNNRHAKEQLKSPSPDPQCPPPKPRSPSPLRNANGNGNGNDENNCRQINDGVKRKRTSLDDSHVTVGPGKDAGSGSGSGTGIDTQQSSQNYNYLSLLRRIDTVVELQLRRSQPTYLSLSRKKEQTPSTSTSSSSSSQKSSLSFSLDKFIGFVSNATDGNSYGGTTKSMTEDLVIVYIITASPELMQVQYGSSDGDGGGDGDNGEGEKGEHRKMKIGFVNTSTGSKVNRLEVLANLYKSKWKGWNTEIVRKLKSQITHHRTLKESRACKRSQESASNSLSNQASTQGLHVGKDAEAILAPGMTLQERILARSNAKAAKLQELAKEKARRDGEDVGNGNNGNGNTTIHTLFADALNLHFRHTSKRQSYNLKQRLKIGQSNSIAESKSYSAATRLRPMPLNEVCAHLSGGYGFRGTGNGGAGQFVQDSSGKSKLGNSARTGIGMRYSKKEVKKVLYELMNIVPEWIQIVSGNKNTGSRIRAGKKTTSSKNLMVLIKGGVSYQMVREKLSGRVVRARSTSSFSQKTSMKLEMTDSRDEDGTKVEVRTGEKPMDKGTSNRIREGVSKGSQRKRTSTSEKKTELFKIQPKRSKLSNGRMRNRAVGATKIAIPQKSTRQSNHQPNVSTANEDNDEELRVNYNQHMTDADYDGGLVLHSNTTNPRGLKRMFSQLNAGGRI